MSLVNVSKNINTDRDVWHSLPASAQLQKESSAPTDSPQELSPIPTHGLQNAALQF